MNWLVGDGGPLPPFLYRVRLVIHLLTVMFAVAALIYEPRKET
jgi:hypothetical protein